MAPDATISSIRTVAMVTAFRLQQSFCYCQESLQLVIHTDFNCISSFEKELKAIDKAILQTVQRLNPNEYTTSALWSAGQRPTLLS